MLYPYHQILSDLTYAQVPYPSYQETVIRGVLDQEFGVRAGKGKWNLDITYIQRGGYKHDRSRSLAMGVRSFMNKMGQGGSYSDVPLKTDGGLFPTIEPTAASPIVQRLERDPLTGLYTVVLNANRPDISVDDFFRVMYKGQPRLLQVWKKPAVNKVFLFPNLELPLNVTLGRPVSMRVMVSDRGIFPVKVVQGKYGSYARETYEFTEYSGVV